ncbi:MAG: hypothetical protein ABI604_10295 [Nitrospirota bacterium]
MHLTYSRHWVPCLILIMLSVSLSHGLWPPGVAYAGTTGVSERAVLLPDDRLVHGTVQAVRSGQIQVDIGELMPVYLSVEAAREKGMPLLQPGDKLTMVVSGENDFIDFHLANQPGWDRVLKGSLLQPMVGDQRWAVIRTTQGLNEPYEVAEGARQTVLNIPVGVPALYLLNKGSIIIDATFGDERALLNTLAKWSKDRQQVLRP